MKIYKTCRAHALIVGISILLASCATHRHHHRHRHHRHHPHPHRVVIVAEQTVEQNRDFTTVEACLAMTEPNVYGSTE